MFAKMVLSFLMKHGLAFIVGLALCAAVWEGHSYMKKQEKEKTELMQKIDVLTKDKEIAVQNSEVAQKAAKTNQLAVEQLQQDMKKQTEVTAALNQRVEKSTQFAKVLTEKVNNTPSAENGTTSSVLRSTIDAIQQKNEAKK